MDAGPATALPTVRHLYITAVLGRSRARGAAPARLPGLSAAYVSLNAYAEPAVQVLRRFLNHQGFLYAQKLPEREK